MGKRLTALRNLPQVPEVIFFSDKEVSKTREELDTGFGVACSPSCRKKNTSL